MLFAQMEIGGVHLLFVVPLAFLVTGIFSVILYRRGCRNLQAEPPMRWRAKGIAQLVACVLIWPATYFSPGVLFRVNHGTDPIDQDGWKLIQKGMSMDEVQAILGPPIEVKNLNGEIVWVYYSDPLYHNHDLFLFDDNGKMVSHWFR